MLRRWRVRLHRVEDALLALLLFALVLLAALQIVLRLGFDTGLVWAEPASRTLVLWLAMLGALAATRDGRHIAIDALPRLFPPSLRRLSWALTQIFAALVCAALAWYCLQLVLLEREAPVALFASVPSWIGMLVLPFGFALMALRFALAAMLPPPRAEAAAGA